MENLFNFLMRPIAKLIASPIATAICLALVLMLAPLRAEAYLDPASGSILLQVILGGVAGAAVALKLFWRRIRAFFGGSSSLDPGGDDDQL
jgi:hypothetical protein